LEVESSDADAAERKKVMAEVLSRYELISRLVKAGELGWTILPRYLAFAAPVADSPPGTLICPCRWAGRRGYPALKADSFV
jgi:DNA-binding transcriptional LysR family regulator